MTRNRKKPFPFFLWHRRIGLFALVLMVILSITGILLNHTEELTLDEVSIESSILLNWYDLNPKGEPIHFRFAEHSLTQWDRQIFFNSQPLISSQELMSGVVLLNSTLVTSLEKMIFLVDKNGELIEQIETEFESIKAIGTYQNHLVVLDLNNQTYIADEHIINWKKTKLNSDFVKWSRPNQPDESLKLSLKQAFRGPGLSLERVILDLHSGRIFNDHWGIYLMDASAIMILLLSISGTWVWYSRRMKMQTKKHYQKHHK